MLFMHEIRIICICNITDMPVPAQAEGGILFDIIKKISK